MNCAKCKTELTVDDVCLLFRGGYLEIDMCCPICDTNYWEKLHIDSFTSDLDLEEEQN